ncbi:TetR/AcrR family transcriptional regulator [Phenylobacterium conjunctum]|uniref:TetR/AcrR family transcriptional regulator n=1 Tax=Phenylobacterium conjunctum TaxID=1298959 RepID=A0ABW3T1S5_9CAUL
MIPPAPTVGVRLTERHQRLVEEMEAIFLSEGFRDLTVNDLAARLRCSKRTLYELAPTKQEIVLLVMERWLARVRYMGSLAAAEKLDPADRMQAYLTPGVTESAMASSRFVEDVQSLRPATLLLEAHQRERINVLREIVENGVRSGRFRPVHAHLVAEMCLASIARFNQPEFLRDAGLSFSEAFSELYQILTEGLAPRSGTRRGRRDTSRPSASEKA